MHIPYQSFRSIFHLVGKYHPKSHWGGIARQDQFLAVVIVDRRLQGWQEVAKDKQMTPYFQRKEELSTEDGCILYSKGGGTSSTPITGSERNP